MNQTIIDNINSVVKPYDELYFLGDFAFGDKTKIPLLREQINCQRIYLLFGNHDTILRKNYTHCFLWCKDYHEFRYKKTLFVLFHYPIGSWNEMSHGSINIHGHCHSNYSRTIGKQIDVGVDALNFMPISIDEVIERMSVVEVVDVDHHNKETQ